MTTETRYRYEKRIKDLNEEINKLRVYRSLALDIFDAAVENSGKNSSLNIPWVLGKYKYLLK